MARRGPKSSEILENSVYRMQRENEDERRQRILRIGKGGT